MKKYINRKTNTWWWIPSLYFAEGIPYVIVMTLSVIFYKRMGLTNTDIAIYTSWLYLPWIIKPIWSPFVDILKTKRWWIITMQLLIGAGLAGIALTIPVPKFLQYTLAFFWLLAFSSATHDIAADGFYLLALSEHKQAYYIGIRSTFYRLAMLTGQGLLVILAGYFETSTGLPNAEIKVNVLQVSDNKLFDPNNINAKTDTTKMYIVSQKEINVGINANKEKLSIANDVDKWNIEHGFYSADSKIENKEHTWYQKFITQPLTYFLKKYFEKKGSETIKQEQGNEAFAYFYLSKKPQENESIVVNINYLSGDKSITTAKTYRFNFTSKNWDIPAFAVFKLHNQLKKQTQTTFITRSGNVAFAWSMVFGISALLFLLFMLYHKFMLPNPTVDVVRVSDNNVLKDFLNTFVSFFKKKNIGVALLFLLVYRLGESQLVKMASPFMLDSNQKNGLGLTTGEIGFIYGTIGIIALSFGGILGGIAASRKGLKYWLWTMALAMNIPNLVYVFLSYAMPSSIWLISVSVAIEQFGYGFGFTAYMLYMVYISEGEHKTAHFALTTGFMALGMMIPGMLSGWLQDIIGYQNFFVWVMICTIPGFLVIPFLKINPTFGKQN